MSAEPSFPLPVINTGVPLMNAQDVGQTTEDRPLTTVTSDGSVTTTTAGSSDANGVTPLPPQNPLEGSNTGTRPLHIRKESSVAFSSLGAANGRDPRAAPEPLAEGAADPENGAAVDYSERTPRRMVGRKGTSDSMLSTGSAVTAADAQTRYVNMLIATDHIHTINNVLAFLFCWLMLAGFVVLPGTIKETVPDIVKNRVQDEELKKALNLVVEHVPLIAVAGGVTGVGLLGMAVMWIRWRGNYIWLVQNLFLPGCTNALAGLISTLVNIFVINTGGLDTLSIVILGVVGGVTLGNFLMIVLYQFFLVAGLQREHKMTVGSHSTGKTGAGKYKGHAKDDEYYAGGN